jgi:hypothetical protein
MCRLFLTYWIWTDIITCYLLFIYLFYMASIIATTITLEQVTPFLKYFCPGLQDYNLSTINSHSWQGLKPTIKIQHTLSKPDE